MSTSVLMPYGNLCYEMVLLKLCIGSAYISLKTKYESSVKHFVLKWKAVIIY